MYMCIVMSMEMKERRDYILWRVTEDRGKKL